ncbi:hypothetical protein D3C78_949320 [compost metagenome]
MVTYTDFAVTRCVCILSQIACYTYIRLLIELDQCMFNLLLGSIKHNMKHVANRLNWTSLYAVAMIKLLSKPLRTLVIFPHFTHSKIEVIVRANDVWIQADQVPAMSSFPNFRLFGKGLIPRQYSTCNTPDSFIKGNIYTIKKLTNFCCGLLIIGQHFKQSGAVQVELNPLGSAMP